MKQKIRAKFVILRLLSIICIVSAIAMMAYCAVLLNKYVMTQSLGAIRSLACTLFVIVQTLIITFGISLWNRTKDNSDYKSKPEESEAKDE